MAVTVHAIAERNYFLWNPSACSEEWVKRTAALRELLRERDSEVAQLQRLLEERAGELDGREQEAAKQAQRIAELEQRIAELEGRIRLLMRQLEAVRQEAAAAAPAGASRGNPAASYRGGRGVGRERQC